MTPKSVKSAFYAGSFNPFTIGHASVVERALQVFDRVVIGIGVNSQKPEAMELAAVRADQIRRYYAGCPEVEVTVYDDLTGDCAKRHRCTQLLRGVRSVQDFEYERNLADANRNIFGLETFILYTLPEQSFVSSSLVRELERYGVDTSRFKP